MIVKGTPKSVKPHTGLKGMDIVLSNLNKEIQAIEGRSLRGLIEFAMLIRRDMDQTPPLIPIDLGNMRASWFIVTAKGTESGGSPSFKGDKSGKLSADYSSAISEARSLAQANSKKGQFLIMGFSANYVVFVHENVGANFAGQTEKIKYTKSGKITASTLKYTRRAEAGAKFFEASMKRNKKIGLETIKQTASIKK